MMTFSEGTKDLINGQKETLIADIMGIKNALLILCHISKLLWQVMRYLHN